MLFKTPIISYLHTRLLTVCKRRHSLDLPLHLCLFCSPCQEFLGQYSISTYWNIDQTLSTKLNSVISTNSLQILPLKISIFFLYFFFVFTQWYPLLHYIQTVHICHLFLYDVSSLSYRDCYKFILNRQPVDSEFQQQQSHAQTAN